MEKKYLNSFVFTILLLSFFSFSTRSQEITVSGFLVDRTISRFGKDFYQYFSVLWQEVPVSLTEDANLVIKETVVPRSGTRLTIEIDNKIIYLTYFGRRNTVVKKQVEQAIFIVMESLVQLDFQAQSDDFANSGY
ncbi:MAG: curli production assembly protein CsgE [Gammaproteobacteria bacterium]|nr:curli production assembly protein CsgE [Gammaproteobacteria bacterium]